MSTITHPTPPVEVEREVTVSDVLTRAADLIEEFGWAQKKAVGYAKPGPFCAGTAYNEALADLGVPAGALVDAYDRLGPPFSNNLPEWNDEPGRTKAEVVATLRAAAERA